MYQFYIFLHSANYASPYVYVDGNYNHPTWRAHLCLLMRRALVWSGVSGRCYEKSWMVMFKLPVHDECHNRPDHYDM